MTDNNKAKPEPDGSQVEPVAARPSRFPVVGIGASAGGLEALEALTRRLSKDGMAFVVLQHLAPGYDSLLADILSRATSVNVVTIRDGLEVEVNHIYVTPPGVELAIREGVFHLSGASEQVPRHSIDSFFRSLASERGPEAIGVVLSGAGSDGTLGLRAIKEEGGITFAQEPSTASQPSMPESALDAGCADFCLSPAEIGDELMRLSAHPYVARRRPPRLFNQDTLSQLFERLRRAFGVDFSTYKVGTIERRIARRMALHKLEKADDYLKLLETKPDELSVLYSDLLIGVTGFFRDREPFETLKTTIFPRLFDKRGADVPIRVWVPGCATGEEAYSIAMCVLEYLDGRPAGYKMQIFGTDIDDHALARAREARYPESVELDVSPGRLQRFFSRREKGYQVSRQLRDMVVFARHNLGKDPPFSRLDLVSCRNVLIYLQAPLQKRVLRVFHYALNPDAFLLLGTSESVGEMSDLFSLVDRKLKIYTKKNVSSAAVFDFARGFRLGPEAADHKTTANTLPSAEHRPPMSIQQLADRTVLEKFGPPGILVNDQMDVVQFRGQTGPYLGPSPGAATLNVLRLIRPEILVELRSAIRKVMSDGLPVSSPALHLGGEGAGVVLEVMPLQQPDTHQKSILVLFRELTPGSTAPAAAARPPTDDHGGEVRLQELERQLLVNKEYLQTSVMDLEAANEELQSSNEELQSSNEELQSSNEELETSKEELQSTNEELATVNEELQNRMAQLAVSNDDLQNALAIVSVPFVIVGMDLRIRRYSAEAERVLSLIPGDLGRPIGYLGSVLDAPELETTVADTINTVRERTLRVRGSDGRSYTMRVVPYRTSEHSIRGALIELLRVPPARTIGEPLEIHELVGKVLSTLPHALLLLDDQLRIVWANKAFFETFVVGAEILGRSLEEVWPSRAALPALWEALDAAAARGVPFADIAVVHPLGRKSDRPMRFGVQCISAERDRPALTLLVIEESAGKREVS